MKDSNCAGVLRRRSERTRTRVKRERNDAAELSRIVRQACFGRRSASCLALTRRLGRRPFNMRCQQGLRAMARAIGKELRLLASDLQHWRTKRM